MAADLQIVGPRIIAVDMEDEVAADRHVRRGVGRTFVGGGAVGEDAIDMDRFVRHPARDAGVDHIDDAADRRRAEEEGGGAAQHLDPVGGQRIDRHRMVGAGAGGVEAADPVGEQAHALALEAAKHRARGIGAEGRGRNARQMLQRLADRGAQIPCEIIVAHHRGSGKNVAAGARKARDDDLVAFRRVEILGRRVGLRLGRRGLSGLGRLGESGRGEGDARQQQGSEHAVTFFCQARLVD
jgi:hypothetical protein